MSRRIKVIQWATGMAGKGAIRVLANHPAFELVGCRVFDKAKVGRDAGELAGIGPIGVIATDDVDEILRTEADAVCFMSLWPDLDAICPLLESGKHVVLTNGLLYPKYLGQAVVDRLEAACRKGGVAVFGGGMNPGFVTNMLATSLTSTASRIDQLVIEEFVDLVSYNSPELMVDMMGFTKTPPQAGDQRHPQFKGMLEDFFHQAIALIAESLKLDLEAHVTRLEYGVSRKGKRASFGDIAEGTVGAVRTIFAGVHGGKEKIVVKLHWIVDFDVDGDFASKDEVGDHFWRVTMKGQPSVQIVQRHDYASAGEGFNLESGGQPATAMSVIQAIPHMVEGKLVGIQTYGTLPMLAGRYAAR